MATPAMLIHACKYGKLDDVEGCLRDGASINGAGDDWSPLMWCAYYGHVEVGKFLIENGADVDFVFAHDGKNAMDCALENNQTKFIRYLSSLPPVPKPVVHHKETMSTISGDVLIHACKYGKIDDARVCLEEGIDPNGKGDDWSPLMWSAYYGHIDIGELLLQYGANIDHIFYHDGKSALDCAKENNQMKFVSFLKKHRHVQFRQSVQVDENVPLIGPKGCCIII